MKSTDQPLPHLTRCVLPGALAITAMLVSACSAVIVHPKPSASATRHEGTVKFTGAGENIDARIVILNDGENFLAAITQGSGEKLLTLSAKFGTDPNVKELPERHMLIARATGPLSKGGWTWQPKDLAKKNSSAEKKLKEPSRIWGALPEVFAWAEAEGKRETFRPCMPDVVMHARADRSGVHRFDFSRHENPTGVDIPLNDLRKQPALETIVCHLDK